MPVPPKIIKLIRKFDEHYDEYTGPNYSEAELRSEFIDPLFEELGWDIRNEQGLAGDYKEVVLERSLDVEGSRKKPDYSFRTGRGPFDFFVEAKRASDNLKDGKEGDESAQQLRRYGYSAKLSLSILTNFKEFSVYSTRQFKPKDGDKAGMGRGKYYKYSELADKWGEIRDLVSKEAIRRGSLEKFVKESKGGKGTMAVDEDFLETIDHWRDLLARNIALRNEISETELNYAVTKTINRLVFLRVCEDRGIERFGHLKEHLGENEIYKKLLRQFLEADDFYDSGLFHFKGNGAIAESLDTLTPRLKVDDKVFREIISSLYGQYEFSVMPVEIIGQVYEQFLGKVIRLSKGGHASVEEKPEVKKAQGVYYTPEYIVDYIVQNTVGKLCEKRTPEQVSKIKVLDPACGSGSFLLGAFKYLINWHENYYQNNQSQHKAKLYKDKNGDVHLRREEKIKILLNNINGVDIDSNAVEVAKLSLYIKILEGENQESLHLRGTDRALPSLGGNIKCGNALIGNDYFQSTSKKNNSEYKRINPFDWQSEFSCIMRSGGFDAVLGNPPYIFTRNQGISDSEKIYFYHHFRHQSAQLNTFGIFLEKSHKLIRDKGNLGFIMPNNWLTIDTFAPLRKFVLESTANLKITNILNRVFTKASVDTAVVLFSKGHPTDLTISEMDNEEKFTRSVDLAMALPPSFIIQINLLKNLKNLGIIKKIEKHTKLLENFCRVSTGLKAYQIGKGKPEQTEREKMGRVYHAKSRRNKTYGKYLEGSDVRRYYLGWSGEFLSYGDWLAEPRKSVPFEGGRILVRQIPSQPPYLINAVFTDRPYYNDINSMVIFEANGNFSLKYLLALINSRIVSFWFQKKFDKLQRKIFPQFKVKELAHFPIPDINLANSVEKLKHDKIVSLVDDMQTLNQKFSKIKTEHEKNLIMRQIGAINGELDKLIYKLYGITDEREIAIIEGRKAIVDEPRQQFRPLAWKEEETARVAEMKEARKTKKYQTSNTGAKSRKAKTRRGKK